MNRRLLSALLALIAAIQARAQSFQADASLPYATHGWNALGFSADAGCFFADHNFLGLEWTNFSSNVTNVYPRVGPLTIRQDVEAVQLVYRYSLALIPSDNPASYALLELYAGGGVGLGRVRQSLPNLPSVLNAYGSQLAVTNTELCGELSAGLQFNFGPHFGVKGGVRYLDSFNNIKQFGVDANTDTKVIELGAVTRF
jgi:opacity protein-like surface antigen